MLMAVGWGLVVRWRCVVAGFLGVALRRRGSILGEAVVAFGSSLGCSNTLLRFGM